MILKETIPINAGLLISNGEVIAICDSGVMEQECFALLDVMYQAIDDYKKAVDEIKELQKLDEGDLQRTIIVDHYHTAIKKIEQQINFVSWMLAEISEVRDDDGE